ncbi:MAG: type I-D CRISPR-associated protein Cas5/Csc1 [Blastocatellia bacterium]
MTPNPKRINLDEEDLKLYAGVMHNHDYLWFSSFEISKTAATLPIIHNYALSYAISGYSYGIYRGSTPAYLNDLANLPAYATPARPYGPVKRTRFTQNAINSRTLRTDDAPKGSNSPALGWRLVLDPVWYNESAATGFSLYLVVRSGFKPPSVVRLGKKGCPVRFQWAPITPAVAVFVDNPVRPTHSVNPLDVAGSIVRYDPVAIPPHLVLRAAEIERDWFVFSGKHVVHVARRFGLRGA